MSQQQQEEDICSVCMSSISQASTIKLRCNHLFHTKCIQTVYKYNRSVYHPITGERILPSCPICHKPINRRPEEPFRENIPKVDINEPAYSSMGDERPVRLSRAKIILQRYETSRRLDELIEQRRIFLAQRQQSSSHHPQPSTSHSPTNYEASQSDQPSTSHLPTIYEDQGSSEAPPPHQLSTHDGSYSSQASTHGGEVFMPSQNDLPTPTYSTPRSPSPLPYPVAYYANSTLTNLEAPSSLPTSSALQQPSQQNIIEINPLKNQLRDIDQPVVCEAGHETPDIEPEEQLEEGVNPVEILGLLGTGRGRHTKYSVRWSDGRFTVNTSEEIASVAPHLLRRWRRANATQNNKKSRENKRSNQQF